MSDQEVTLRDQASGSGGTCRNVLAALPTWFGIEESVENYVEVADRSPTVVATANGQDVGLLTTIRHGPKAAEVYVMGVLPQFHRRGIGRRMLARTEKSLGMDGIVFLQVKTLSAAHPDEGYSRTRAFYLSCGFTPLEEFPDLWQPGNPALQMIKTLPPVPHH
jgi:ribosomal protein S18 acetylase RimI-like enzyme